MALISYLTRIQFDHGALALLSQELLGLDVKRPLIVSDRGIEAAGLLDRLRDALKDTEAPAIFTDTPSNPTEGAARAALALYRKAGCDGIIGFGGGSSIDLAKAVRLMTSHDGPLSRYAMSEGGAALIKEAMPPLVAIPTTAGTGSEVGRGAVVIMEDGRKLGVVSPLMIPSLALCDPDLTTGLPVALTAATGMDAAAHCIETFLSPAINPPAEAIALDGLSRCVGFLEQAVQNGANRHARWQMMMAAMEGAMAFQKGLGAVHALSHPLGALRNLNLHHGTLNAVLLPAVLHFNAQAVDDKMETLAAVLGCESASDVPSAVGRWVAMLELPANLAAMGITREDFPRIADEALNDHCHLTNPRRAERDDYLRMLEQAYIQEF